MCGKLRTGRLARLNTYVLSVAGLRVALTADWCAGRARPAVADAASNADDTQVREQV